MLILQDDLINRKMADHTPPGVLFHRWKDSKEYQCEFAIFQDMNHLVEGVDHYIETKQFKYIEKRDHDTWVHGALKNINGTKHALNTITPHDNILRILKQTRARLSQCNSLKNTMRNATEKRASIKFKDHGDELDMGRLMSGSPEHWSLKHKNVNGEAIKLHINIGMSAGNGDDEFANIVAVTIVAAELLQRMGKSVEIIAITNHELSGSRHGLMFKVKKAHEPLNISKIAILGSTGLFRHYGFHVVGNCIEDNGNYMGNAQRLSEEHLEALDIKYLISKDWNNGKESEFLSKIFKGVSGD
jgi:hypothetical protein